MNARLTTILEPSSNGPMNNSYTLKTKDLIQIQDLIGFLSSEESDIENNDEEVMVYHPSRIVREITWESTELKSLKICVTLD